MRAVHFTAPPLCSLLSDPSLCCSPSSFYIPLPHSLHSASHVIHFFAIFLLPLLSPAPLFIPTCSLSVISHGALSLCLDSPSINIAVFVSCLLSTALALYWADVHRLREHGQASVFNSILNTSATHKQRWTPLTQRLINPTEHHLAYSKHSLQSKHGIYKKLQHSEESQESQMLLRICGTDEIITQLRHSEKCTVGNDAHRQNVISYVTLCILKKFFLFFPSSRNTFSHILFISASILYVLSFPI